MTEKKLTTGQDDNLARVAAVVFAAAINAAQLGDTQKEELKGLLHSPSGGASVPRGLKSVYPKVLEAQKLFDRLPGAKRQEVLTIVVRAIANPPSETDTTIPQPPASNTNRRPTHGQQRQDELLTTQEAKRLPPHTSIRAFQKRLQNLQILSNAPIRSQLRDIANEIVVDNRRAFPSGVDARLRAYKHLLALAADGLPYHLPFEEVVVGQCTPGRNRITG